MITEGFIATDFFSKSKTNISEGIGFLGSFPIGKNMEQVATNKKESYYGFSLPNILNDLGYVTTYLHPNVKEFYSRDETHTHLGFQQTFFGDDAVDGTIEWCHWLQEEAFIREAYDQGYLYPVDEFGNYTGQNFFTFYTSVSTHGPYVDNKDNADQVAYVNQVLSSEWYKNASSAYSGETLNYLVNFEAAVVGLDHSIKFIVEQLQREGIYDETTIVLYSDHNAYYHTLSNSIKGVSKNNYANIELNTVPLIIKSRGLNKKIEDEGYYNSETNPDGVYGRDDRYYNKVSSTKFVKSTDRFCSAYDILPTILDLLGIEYNVNYYAGNSLFTKLKNVVKTYSPITKEEGEEFVVAYYSHTGGVFGKYGMTRDLHSYTYFFPDNYISSSTYTKVLKKEINSLMIKLNYIATLYSYGIYRLV